MKKWKKQVSIRATRMELLEALDNSCTSSSRVRWEAQLSEVYRRRSIDLSRENGPDEYDAKYMDSVFESSFKGDDVLRVQVALD